MHVSGAPVFVAAAEMMPLVTWLWRPGGLAVPQDCNNQRVSSWVATTLRALHRQRLKPTPSPSVKKAYLLVLELWPEGQASCLSHI